MTTYNRSGKNAGRSGSSPRSTGDTRKRDDNTSEPRRTYRKSDNRDDSWNSPPRSERQRSSSGRDSSGRKPFRKKSEDGDKPYRERSQGTGRTIRKRFDDRERKPYRKSDDNTERKPFRKREHSGEESGERKNYRDKKPYRKQNDDRPRKTYRKNEQEGDGGERREYRKRTGFRKQDDDRPRKTYRKNEQEGDGGERREYKKRTGFRKQDDDRPRKTYRKNEQEGDGGERREYKKRTGFRKQDDDRPRKTYRKNDQEGDSGERREYRKRTGYRNQDDDRPRKSYRRDDHDQKPYRKRQDGYKSDRKDAYQDKRKEKTFRSDSKNVKKDSDEIRLNRYIASTGNCSRREADEFIKLGLVSVNDKVITEMGVKVKPGDVVKLNGETIRPGAKVYILMNKPKDYITTTDDPRERKIVTDLLDPELRSRVYPVGRLDRNTTGVLLLTNDGEMTRRLLHPSQNKKKIYHVFLDKNIKPIHIQQLLEGIELDDGPVRADAVQYADENDKSQLGVELHSGKYHIVRRMFEYLGYDVIKLDRVYFAGLTKKGVERGHWRYLTEKEINMLKIGAFD